MGREKEMQLALDFSKKWGGKRRGAGRKATGKFGRDGDGKARSGVGHKGRDWHGAHVPLHVTVRGVQGAPSLRSHGVAAVIGALMKRRAARPVAMRVVHFSLQRDHVHTIAEADDKQSLGRGMQGLLSQPGNRNQSCHRKSRPILARSVPLTPIVDPDGGEAGNHLCIA